MSQSTVLLECFKKKIRKDKFVDWLNCHNITDEGNILSEIKDLQFRGHDVSHILVLVNGGVNSFE